MAKQTFVASTVLTAAQMNALQANDYNQTVSTKTASYTLVAADAGTRIVMNSASATTITVNTSLFSAADTLFLQNIGAGTCTVTAGTATVATAGSLAIPQNGGGLLYFTSAGVSIFYPSAGANTSKIAQVVTTTKTDTFTMASSTYADVTGLSLSITPTLATSTIYLIASITAGGQSASTQGFGQFVRNSTAIGVGAAASNRVQATFPITLLENAFTVYSLNASFVDSPATTSATTYKIQVRREAAIGTIYINRSENDSDSSSGGRYISTITALEVLA